MQKQQQLFKQKSQMLKQNTSIAEEAIVNEKKERKIVIVDKRYTKQIEGLLKETYTMEKFFDLVNMVFNHDIINQHHGIIGIRKIISTDKKSIQTIIDAGLVPKMLDHVRQDNYPQLQLQAIQILLSMTMETTKQIQPIVDNGGISLFISLLLKQNLRILGYAIWAIGNICSDCVLYRDSVLKEGGMINLIKIIKNPNIKKHKLIIRTVWAITNLCRGNPMPKANYIKEAILILCQIIQKEVISDMQIMPDICWSIMHSLNRDIINIQQVIASGVIPKIISMLESEQKSILIPCLMIIGNISQGNTEQIDATLEHDLIFKLQALLYHQENCIKRQTCYILSNIAAGSRQQAESVLSHSNLITKLIKLWVDDSIGIRKEICIIFSNFVSEGQTDTLCEFYKKNQILNNYISIIKQNDPETLEIALDSLQKILYVGEKFRVLKGFQSNPFTVDLIKLGILEIIKKLQQHQSLEVRKKIAQILDQYLSLISKIL